MSTPGFDARAYWEQRLTDDYSLTGVGFRRLGPSFNRWAYQVRHARFEDVIARLDLNVSRSSVVDVGSGTGFYIERWLDHGAAVTGLDLTETAVENLRANYPHATFMREDISDPSVVDRIGVGTIDAVSAMDVLFHIVDDAAFTTALGNIARLLRPGGYLLYSDMFVHRATQRVPHRVTRPLRQIEATLDAVGLEVVERRPLFYLMNDPLDARRRMLRGAWFAIAGLVSTSDRIGRIVGRGVYPLEMKLTRDRAESPTTELMVCRRR